MYIYTYIHIHSHTYTYIYIINIYKYIQIFTQLNSTCAQMRGPGCKVPPQEPKKAHQETPQAVCTLWSHLETTKCYASIWQKGYLSSAPFFVIALMSSDPLGDSVWYRSKIHTRCSHPPRCPESLSPFQPGQLQGWLSETLLWNSQPWASKSPNFESCHSAGCGASHWAPHEEEFLSTQRLDHP